MSTTEIDRNSHSYLLGVAEYHRDKYKAALERIAKMGPTEKPEPAYEAGYGYRSEGNSDDVVSDCVNDAMWDIAEIARAALKPQT